MFGHGFIPRITDRNRAGVQRALSPGDLFGGEPPELPAVIIDGPAVHRDPTIASGLKAPQRTRLVDTAAWRFAFGGTWESAKWTSLPYTPSTPFDATTRWITDYVRGDLLFQADAGVEAYLLPAWFQGHGRDLRPMMAEVFAATEAMIGAEVDPRPVFATLPTWRTDLRPAYQALDELHGAITGVYALVNRWTPMSDAVDSLVEVISFLAAVEESGRSVIAARGGAMTPVLTSLGVSAADAGLGEGEQFDASSSVRAPAPKTGMDRGPRFGPRIYMPAIGRSLSGKEWQTIQGHPKALAAVVCDERCCRMRGSMSLAQGRAAEHSLTTRVVEAEAVSGPTAHVRQDRALDQVVHRIERLKRVNAVLNEAGAPPLRDDHLTNQRALLSRYLRRGEAA